MKLEKAMASTAAWMATIMPMAKAIMPVGMPAKASVSRIEASPRPTPTVVQAPTRRQYSPVVGRRLVRKKK